MKGYFYRYNRNCNEQLLGEMIAKQPEDAWIYLENDYPLPPHDDYAVYLKFRVDAVEAERYSVGRVFNRNFEMRWQRLSGEIIVQLLCEDEKYLQDNFTLIEEFTVKDSSMYLWGTHTSNNEYMSNSKELRKYGFIVQADAWIETRIPRPLEYPMLNEATPEHVQIKTRCYHERTGILRTTRWLALEGVKR